MPSIYLLQAGENGPIKIGFAVDVRRRLNSYLSQHPMPLRLLGVMDGDKQIEKQLLKKFASSRLRGEWFNPSEDLITFALSFPTPSRELSAALSVPRYKAGPPKIKIPKPRRWPLAASRSGGRQRAAKLEADRLVADKAEAIWKNLKRYATDQDACDAMNELHKPQISGGWNPQMARRHFKASGRPRGNRAFKLRKE